MRAAVIQETQVLAIKDVEMPIPADNEVVIKVMASGICGTDLHIYMGDYKGTYPIIPGHEFSGVITEKGPEVTDLAIGDRVAVEPNLSCGLCYNCLNHLENFCEHTQAVGVTRPGAMAEYVAVPRQAVFPIGELSFEEAAFMEPLSCVLHGVERLAPSLGDTALLIGAGPIGLLLLQNLKAAGCSRIDVVDLDPSRLRKASEMGASKTYTDLDTVNEEAYHLVIDATGASKLLERSLYYARPSGKILWFGVPHVGSEVPVPPFRMFEKQLSIITSYTSCRNSYQTLQLLQSGSINVKDLISHRLPLEEFERGIQVLQEHSEPAMKILIMPNT